MATFGELVRPAFRAGYRSAMEHNPAQPFDAQMEAAADDWCALVDDLEAQDTAITAASLTVREPLDVTPEQLSEMAVRALTGDSTA